MLDYIFPKIDLNSKKIGDFLDKDMKKKFISHDEICYKCKKESKDFQTHSFCNQNIKKLVSCFYYTNEIKKYILSFKYYHRSQIVEEIGQLMNLYFNIYFWKLKKEETWISYVPMHWLRKYFIKWYNQWQLLAEVLWKKNNIKVVKICKKSKYTKPQAKIKSRKQRLINLKWSFNLNLEIPENIKNIVIVDDIITTWTTIEELANCIKQKYPNINIYSIVLARK